MVANLHYRFPVRSAEGHQPEVAKNDAIVKNKNLLKKNPYTYIQPEHVKSLEAGYKGLFAEGRIFAEADFYFKIIVPLLHRQI